MTLMANDRTFSWRDLAFIREHWEGPVVLKGILHPDDARRAADSGADGIVVSNHGGRQVDGAIAALDALPAVVDAVGDRLTVLLDSGVRTGADVFLALALGASAVVIGRLAAYGLAAAGEHGVRRTVELLTEELHILMTLAGIPDIGSLTSAAAAPRP
jgi:isopentenyl diphosphate isomerase/L-lactate dehydrogenase-like FMN-dependent dehydrogenase